MIVNVLSVILLTIRIRTEVFHFMNLVRRCFGIKDYPENSQPTLMEMYKENLSIAWPATVEGALMAIIGSVDTMMVGTLGSEAIAAVGITGQPRMILLILAQALCVGTTALVARRKGADDRAGANSTLMQSMFVVTLLGFLMAAVGYIFAEPFMRFAGANEETLGLATDYFKIIALGFPCSYWNLCLCAAMRAIGKTRITMVTNITANLVNVCFNYCLIGGHLGFPALGVRGAALATTIGTCVACVIAFWFSMRPDGYLQFRFRIPKFDRITMGGLFKVGSSSMAESVFLRLGFLINARLIAGIGTSAMATYQIVQQTTGLSFTLGDGIAAAGATMVGQSLGAKRKDLAMANVRISRKLSVVTSLVLMALILVFRRSLAALFTTDEAIIYGATLAFLVVVVGILPQNGRVVYSGCLRGAGDVKYVAVCSLISVAILRPIFTYVLCYPVNEALPRLQMAMTGPWIAFVLDAFVREILLYHRIRQGKWLNIRL